MTSRDRWYDGFALLWGLELAGDGVLCSRTLGERLTHPAYREEDQSRHQTAWHYMTILRSREWVAPCGQRVTRTKPETLYGLTDEGRAVLEEWSRPV